MEEIRSLALTDTLTRLPNRNLLEDRIDIAIAQAHRTGLKVAVLFIDLDNFKQINDIQGHKAGDNLLVSISNILRQHLRMYDTLARWGGDEFVILLPDVPSLEDARRIGEKLKSSVEHELTQDQQVHTSMSIGLAVFPDDADNTESLLIQADKALYYCKSHGRNKLRLYSDISASSLGYAGTNLTARFAAAVKAQLLQVHYQPIVDASSKNVVAVEALARWHDEQHGWVSPAIFISMAETMGLIESVGNQVAKIALQDYGKCPWHNQVRLAINVSNRQLFSKTFLPDLLAMLQEHRVQPDSVKLEITESTALEADHAFELIQALSDAGFYVALDDFGTGFSSLSRLHELPVDELKIDISFVRRCNTEKGRTMIKTIIEMGRSMNLKLVAEGVEDGQTAELLRDFGVDYLQGYYFAKPQPAEDCKQLVDANYAAVAAR